MRKADRVSIVVYLTSREQGGGRLRESGIGRYCPTHNICNSIKSFSFVLHIRQPRLVERQSRERAAACRFLVLVGGKRCGRGWRQGKGANEKTSKKWNAKTISSTCFAISGGGLLVQTPSLPKGVSLFFFSR